MTRDISVQGAFIWATTRPPAGSAIRVDLLLPPVSGLTPVMRITGAARVIRVDHVSQVQGTNGFAIMTDELNQWGLAGLADEPDAALAGKGSSILKLTTN